MLRGRAGSVTRLFGKRVRNSSSFVFCCRLQGRLRYEFYRAVDDGLLKGEPWPARRVRVVEYQHDAGNFLCQPVARGEDRAITPSLCGPREAFSCSCRPAPRAGGSGPAPVVVPGGVIRSRGSGNPVGQASRCWRCYNASSAWVLEGRDLGVSSLPGSRIISVGNLGGAARCRTSVIRSSNLFHIGRFW